MLEGAAVVFIIVFPFVLVASVLAYYYLQRGSPSSIPSGNSSGNNSQCKDTAACLTDTVTYIFDGDILDVGSTRIRSALVNTSEVGQPGYAEGEQFTAQTCPVGSPALADEDDGQTDGSYGRRVAGVYCSGINLNLALLSSGYAVLVPSIGT